jgi:hypothetical protein
LSTPNHYTRWKIEPITFIQENDLDFLRGNIIKYIMRYDDKDGLKDLEKARQYLDWLIEGCEAEEDISPYDFEIPDGRIRPTITPFLTMTEADLIAAERALYEREGYTNPKEEAQGAAIQGGKW